tara:strand:- start:1490 stop:1852 length:363 start_codon:yes stop_codon:yes gene_type:complete
MNKYCFTNFLRSRNDLKVEQDINIPHYQWDNQEKGIDFELFKNKYYVRDDQPEQSNSLFSFTNSKELSLIESHKEVDFFIKQNCYFSTSNLIEKMSTIKNISLVYRVQNNELSENFNFDL